MTAAIWLVAFLSVVGGIATAAPSAVAATDPVVMAAGDIACPPGSARRTKCRDDLTAAKLGPATHVITVGDNQYLCGALADFRAAYDKTWGQVLSKTYPVVGGDDYAGGGCTTRWRLRLLHLLRRPGTAGRLHEGVQGLVQLRHRLQLARRGAEHGLR